MAKQLISELVVIIQIRKNGAYYHPRNISNEISTYLLLRIFICVWQMTRMTVQYFFIYKERKIRFWHTIKIHSIKKY